MKKGIFEEAGKELANIGLLFLLSLAIFKIVFFKENLLILLRSALSLFWLFVLPGYFAMLYWKEKLDFAERIVAGSILCAALIGIAGYYISLIGLNIKYNAVLLPLAIIIIGVLASRKK